MTATTIITLRDAYGAPWTDEQRASSTFHRDVSTLALLCSYVNPRNGTAFPHMKTLAEVASCSVDTMKRACTRLVEMGMLERVRLRTCDGANRGYLYRVPWLEWPDPVDVDEQGVLPSGTTLADELPDHWRWGETPQQTGHGCPLGQGTGAPSFPTPEDKTLMANSRANSPSTNSSGGGGADGTSVSPLPDCDDVVVPPTLLGSESLSGPTSPRSASSSSPRAPRRRRRPSDTLPRTEGGHRIYPDDFEAFFTEYPRGASKAGAYDAWVNDLDAADRALAVQGAARYAATDPDPQYVPHASTWLRGKRWEDEIDDRDLVNVPVRVLDPGAGLDLTP